MRSNISTGCWNVGTEGMKWYFVKWSSLKCSYSPMFKKNIWFSITVALNTNL